MTANRPGFQWTPRQREVLDLLAKGHTNGQIAERLGISLDGAKWHVSEILSKLQTNSRDEAADYWRRQNGLPARLVRLSRAFAVGLAVAVVFYVIAGGGEDAPANPGDDNDPSPTPPSSATATPASAVDDVERWGNFVLMRGAARPREVVEQDIPEELEGFRVMLQPGGLPWSSPRAFLVDGRDETAHACPGSRPARPAWTSFSARSSQTV